MNPVFPVLEEKMKQKKITARAIEELLQISAKSLFNKRYGASEFTWTEVSKIRESFFPEMSSDELFRKEV